MKAVTEFLRRQALGGDTADEHRPTGLYPIVAVATGLVLLVGSVVASAVAVTGAPTQRAAPALVTTAAITGADALRPDVIDSTFGPATGVAAPPVGLARGLPAPPPVSNQGAHRPPPPPATRPAPPLAPAQPAPPLPAAPLPAGVSKAELGGDPVLGTVVCFYREATVAPQEAFSLLAPQMRGPGFADFRAAWADVQQVSVDRIRRDGPDTAAVTVTIERTDGTVLRSLQTVRVVPGAPAQIVDARLLSAARS